MAHHVGVLQEGGGHGQVAHSGGGNERVGQIKIVKGLQTVRLRKTRGLIPDGLVQTRILNFTRKFPNLGGGTSDQGGSSIDNYSGKRKLCGQPEPSCKKMKVLY